MKTAIDRAIEAAGSVQALAERAGVSVPAVYFWRTGEREISAESAIKLERATGIPRAKFRPDLFGAVA